MQLSRRQTRGDMASNFTYIKDHMRNSKQQITHPNNRYMIQLEDTSENCYQNFLVIND